MLGQSGVLPTDDEPALPDPAAAPAPDPFAPLTPIPGPMPEPATHRLQLPEEFNLTGSEISAALMGFSSYSEEDQEPIPASSVDTSNWIKPDAEMAAAVAARYKGVSEDAQAAVAATEPAEEQGFFERSARGAAEFGVHLAGDALGGIATMGDLLERAFTDTTAQEQAARGDWLRWGQTVLGKFDAGYEPGKYTDPDQLLGAFGSGDIVNGFLGALEIGIISAPTVVGVLGNPGLAVSVASGLAENYAQEYMTNIGQEGEPPTAEAFSRGAIAATVDLTVDRLGLHMFSRALKKAGISNFLGAIGVGAVAEGVAEGTSYTATTAGTGEFTPGGLGKSAAVGSIVGGTMGGAAGSVGTAVGKITGGADRDKEAAVAATEPSVPPMPQPAAPPVQTPAQAPVQAPVQPPVAATPPPPPAAPGAAATTTAPEAPGAVPGATPTGPVAGGLPEPAPLPTPQERTAPVTSSIEPAAPAAVEPVVDMREQRIAQLVSDNTAKQLRKLAKELEVPVSGAKSLLAGRIADAEAASAEAAVVPGEEVQDVSGRAPELPGSPSDVAPEGPAVVQAEAAPSDQTAPRPELATPAKRSARKGLVRQRAQLAEPAGRRSAGTIVAELNKLKTPEEKRAFVQSLAGDKAVTHKVIAEVAKLQGRPRPAPKRSDAIRQLEQPFIDEQIAADKERAIGKEYGRDTPTTPEPAPEPEPAPRLPRQTTAGAALTKLGLPELREQAKALGIKSVKGKPKAKLAEEIVKARQAAAAPAARAEAQSADMAATPESQAVLAQPTPAEQMVSSAAVARNVVRRKKAEAAAPAKSRTMTPVAVTPAYSAGAAPSATPVPRLVEAAQRANVDINPLIEAARTPPSAPEVRKLVRTANVLRREMGMEPIKVANKKSENLAALQRTFVEAAQPTERVEAQAAEIIQRNYVDPLTTAKTKTQRNAIAKKAKEELPRGLAKKFTRLAKLPPESSARELLHIVIDVGSRDKPKTIVKPYTPEALEAAQKEHGARARAVPKGREVTAVKELRAKSTAVQMKREVKKMEARRKRAAESDLAREARKAAEADLKREGRVLFESKAPEGWTEVDTSVPKVLNTIGKMRAAGQIDFPLADALKMIEAEVLPQFKPIVKSLRKAFNSLPEAERPQIFIVPESMYSPDDPAGTYNAKTNLVRLYEGAGPYVTLHELIHAATVHKLTYAAHYMSKQLSDLHKVVYDDLKARGINPENLYGLQTYGRDRLTILAEFVAEAFSRPEFQEALRSVKMPAQLGTNAWTKFIDFVRRTLGMRTVSRNALDVVMDINRTELFDLGTFNAQTTGHMFESRSQLDSVFEDRGGAAMARGRREINHLQGVWQRKIAPNLIDLSTQVRNWRDLFVAEEGGKKKYLLDIAAGNLLKMTQAINHEQRAGRLVLQEINKYFMQHKSTNAPRDFSEALSYFTLHNVDPTESYGSQWNLRLPQAAYDAARKRYDALDAKGKELIKTLRDFYRDEWERITNGVLKNILKHYYDVDEAQLNTHVQNLRDYQRNVIAKAKPEDRKELRERFVIQRLGVKDGRGADDFFEFVKDVVDRARIGFYVPSKRWGNYVVEVEARLENDVTMPMDQLDDLLATYRHLGLTTDGRVRVKDMGTHAEATVGLKLRIVEFAENAHAAEDMQARVIEGMDELIQQMSTLGTWNKTKFGGLDTMKEYNFDEGDAAGKLMAALRRKNKSGSLSNPQFETMRQAMITLMPSTSIHMASLHRKGVTGASQDHLRALAAHTKSSASYLAGLEWNDRIENSVADLHKFVDKKAQAGTNVMHEREIVKSLAERYQHSGRIADRPGWSRALMSLGFFNFLGSLSYPIVNLTQTTYGQAKLASEFGAVKTFKTFNDVFWGLSHAGIARKVGGAMSKDVLSWDVGTRSEAFARITEVVQQHIADTYKSPNLDKIVADAIERGTIDMTLGADVAAFMKGAPDTSTWGGKGKSIPGLMLDVTRYLPHAVEIMNRASTLVTAYQLTTEAYPNMEFDDVLRKSIDVVDQTQFNYTAIAEAKWISEWGSPIGPATKPVFMFKKFALGVYNIWIDMATGMLGPNRTRAERLEAMRFAAYFFGSQAALAGVLGAVLIEPIRFALWLMGTILDDEDDPIEWHEDAPGQVADFVRDMVRTAGLPDYVADAALSGVPNALGFDLSGRLGLDNVIMFDLPGQDPEEKMKNFFMELLGPLPDLALNGTKMMSAAARGQSTGEILSKAPAKFFKDIGKAITLADEGLVDSRGNLIIAPDEFDFAEILTQAIGFMPGKVARHYEDTTRRFDIQGRQVNRRNNLMQRYVNAFDDQNAEEAYAVIDEIQRFNKSAITPITMQSIKGSVKRRKDAEVRAKAGLYGRSNKEALRWKKWSEQRGVTSAVQK